MKELERVILADPKTGFWGFANSVYENIKKIEEKEGKIGFILKNVYFTYYPDGEIEPRIDANCRNRPIIFVHDASKEPCRYWVELMLFNDAANRGGAERITNVLPHSRWTRGKKKDKPHMPIATKIFFDTISLPCIGSKADRIVTMDLHADAEQGFTNNPIDHLWSSGYIAPILIEKINHYGKICFVGPDLGSLPRAKRNAGISQRNEKGIDISIAAIDKDRISGDKTKAGYVVGDVRDRVCIIVDDIGSTGGTLSDARNVLFNNGAKEVYAYVTHFVGVGNYKGKLADFAKVFVTNDFYHPKEDFLPNMEQIDVSPLFARAIYNAETGESISELFK